MFLPMLKCPVTFDPFWGTAYPFNFYSPSAKPVWECNVLLKQNILKSQNLSIEWRFPSLKSYPSSCFLLFCLLAAVWTLPSFLQAFSAGTSQAWLVPSQASCEHCVTSALPRGFQTAAPALTEPVQVTFPGWQLNYALETDSWILPFLLASFEEGGVLISAICRTCSVGWTVYLGDVYCLYFSPTICATESPEKLLLAWKSGHLSDT